MKKLLSMLLFISILVITANTANLTPVEANSIDILSWTMVNTPNSTSDGTRELWNGMNNTGAEINRLLVGINGTKLYVLSSGPASLTSNNGCPILWKSTDSGVTWSTEPTENLISQIGADWANYLPIWDMAIAPDNPNIIAVVLDKDSASVSGPLEVWISTDGGVSWEDTVFPDLTVNIDGVISCIDISIDYGGKHDIVVGLRNGIGDATIETLFVQTIPNLPAWEDNALPDSCDVMAVKFSPTYNGDQGIVAVTSGVAGTATWMNIGIHNTNNNTTNWATFGRIEVKKPSSSVNASPDATTIITADVELPSDYSAQSASLRRAYINLDAGDVLSEEDGIFRIDDTVVYVLMDNSIPFTRRISSIAYYGTHASGKLLAGEVMGYPGTATVPIWFTDSPTVIPIPCWYPALKPPTGAANQGTPGSQDGYGNAQVAWSRNGVVAYTATGSAALGTFSAPDGAGTGEWPDGYLNQIYLDESALSITRNNGETWNQLSMIDTKIDKLTDIVPSADSSTVYLATVNEASGYSGFDSVWRSSNNLNVISPGLPAADIGTIWERIRCHVTANVTTDNQSDYAILRVAPNYTDGRILFWAAKGATPDGTHGVAAWSPDFGDYWANITPNLVVQDMAVESSSKLYFLDDTGYVHYMPYTGFSWSGAIPNVDTTLGSGFSIAALAGGHVLVGAGSSSADAVAYSANNAASFSVLPQLGSSNFQVAFDADFATNGAIYAAAANTTVPRGIYRSTGPSYSQWTDLESLNLRYYGLAVGSQGALYAANPLFVERTLHPETDIPGELGEWDILKFGLNGFPIRLTLEPNALKLSGGLTPSQNTILWAIDDSPYLSPTLDCGRLWKYEDSFAKSGPAVNGNIFAEYGTLINISWGQVSGARYYEIQQADDSAFTTGVRTHPWYEPFDPANPRLAIPICGLIDYSVNTASWISTLSADVFAVLGISPNMDAIGLESIVTVESMYAEGSHVYYQRVRVIGSNGEDIIRSPWSATLTVTIGPVLPPKYYLQMNLLGTSHSVETNSAGRLDQTLEVSSADGTLTITIPEGTLAKQENGNRLTNFVVSVNENPRQPPENKNIIGLAYNFEPDGATFTPYLILTFTYDPGTLPEGVAEEDLVLAFYDEDTGEWIECECTCDPENNCITACICHFTDFAIIAPVPPPPTTQPAPAAFSLYDLTVQPAEVKPEETVTITVSVANTGGTLGSYTILLYINGAIEAEKGVTVSAGGSEVVSFSISRQEAGSYSVTVDILSGSFTVLPAPAVPTAPATPATTSIDSSMNWIIFGIVIGVVLVVVLTVLLTRRRKYLKP